MKTWNLGYEKSKQRAKKYYSKIGTIRCPALGDSYVSFSRTGFNHIIRKGRIPRTRNEQKRRFVLLKYVEDIIKNPKAFIIYRKETIKEKVNRHGEKILIESTAHFWTLVDKIEDCNIKVVIMQRNNGDKKFFSVMGDQVKINNKRKKKQKIL
jgi:hypothetical protein